MIPPFNEDGYLPAGVHLATLAEVEARFGRKNEIRRAEFESLRWLVDLAKAAGVERLVINGSFVTNVEEPNDVDCVLLMGPTFPADAGAESELLNGLPFIEIQLVRQSRFTMLVESFFASDRHMRPKGMVEVIL